MNSSYLYFFTLLNLVFFTPKIFAYGCSDSKANSKILPDFIGKENQTLKSPYLMTCDTMIVPKGSVTTIYPGTMLYFSQPSLHSIIKVEGLLRIMGNKDHFISISGSLDSTRFTVEAGNKQWGGIEIEDGGQLQAEYVGFVRAPTPITSLSRKVKLVNSWFRGSSGMNLPDGSFATMDPKWHAINNLDLSLDSKKNEPIPEAPLQENLSQNEKKKLLASSQKVFWTWPKIAGSAILVSLIGGGAVVAMMPDKKSSKPNPPKPDNSKETNIDAVPSIPTR